MDSEDRATKRKRPRSRRRSASGSEDSDSPQQGRLRRAPTACRVCRSRKVKCSNERPTCAACVRLGCECVYPDSSKHMRTDHDTTIILDRLQQILERLPDDSRTNINTHSFEPPGAAGQARYHAEAPTLPFLAARKGPSPFADSVILGEPPGFVSLDYVFQWPIFQSDGANRFTPDNLLVTDQALSQDESVGNARIPSRLPALDDQEIPGFVQKFLAFVHIKNPVLHCNTLLSDARLVAELGPQWDATSCLVLVTAALGAVAKPFDPMPWSVERLSTRSPGSGDQATLLKAEAYYQSARRRFGLLDRSLTACHCHLISGIYLMYTMRPLQGWQSFSAASTIYTVYLRSRNASQHLEHDGSPEKDVLRCHLEQRLYWSCIKSESEVCSEVTLPRSNLSSIDYPYMFPSPPSPTDGDEMLINKVGKTAEPVNTTTASPSTGSTSSGLELQAYKSLQEQSWFYYLSEIAMLRLSSRINHTFYSEDRSSWSRMNVLDMANAARDFESQLQQWKNSLPASISWFDTPLELGTITELQTTTWSRYSCLQLRIYRPFLYRLAHPQDQDWMLTNVIQPFAEKAVLISLDPLFTLALGHRHAGTWYKCRETAGRALMLLCARKLGLTETMQVGEETVEMLKLCMAHLRHWENESSDLELARQIIESMYTKYYGL